MHALYMRLGKERSFLYFCPYKNPSFLRTYIFMLLNTTFMHKFSKKKRKTRMKRDLFSVEEQDNQLSHVLTKLSSRKGIKRKKGILNVKKPR